MGNTIMKWVPNFIPTPDEDYDSYSENKETLQTEKKLQNDESDDHVLLNCKDVDLVNIVNFLANNLDENDVDVKDLKHMIAGVLKKHQTAQYHPVFEALQYALKSQGEYKDMMKAIDGLVNGRKLAIIKRTKNNQASQETEFHANVEAMGDLVTHVLAAAGAGPVGPILVSLLRCVKKVNFFTSKCRTEGHKDETLGIVDIHWDTETRGTVEFEIAKIAVNMVDENGEVLFVGSKKVYVNIDMYYARATMKLESFMTPEELKELKANINTGVKLKANPKKGFTIEG